MLPEYALWDVYTAGMQSGMPESLVRAADTPVMLRLGHVGMNCGCEYTAFPRFRNGRQYSRLIHSIGVGMIVWKHTGDETQAMAGLLHDIATPVFAHVIDSLRGDYLTQEATEDGTEELIEHSDELQAILRDSDIRTEKVSNYHLYPIADNDAPGLCADRLEYTLGNLCFYGFASVPEIRDIYMDIHAGVTADGRKELMFTHRETAETFGMLALNCSKVYVSDEDRYAMQLLSEIVGKALKAGVIQESDLHGTEEDVISALEESAVTADAWQWFRNLCRMESGELPGTGEGWRSVRAKKRYIDPYIDGTGRLTSVSRAFQEALDAFRTSDQTGWLRGLTR